MHRIMWHLAGGGLGLGVAAFAAGWLVDGFAGRLAVGYGVLIIAAGLWLLAGLLVLERRRPRTRRSTRPGGRATRLAGPRVF